MSYDVCSKEWNTAGDRLHSCVEIEGHIGKCICVCGKQALLDLQKPHKNWTIEQHRDELIERLGAAIRRINELERQLEEARRGAVNPSS